MTQNTIWTIGHSTHDFDDFVAILKSFEIEIVIDVRSLPGSNRYPQYNKESLEITLPENNIEYNHIKGLGGLRKATKNSLNTVWKVASFRNYADYMETSEFKESIIELEKIAVNKRTVIMCAEVLWWRCHRSMISDYLLSRKWNVVHIMGLNKSTEHTYTNQAKIIDGEMSYNE